ncbi:MAG: 1-(5-phosphoribosyl)-5-[(5-phosphoribosylamino)methylideneamino]imidazole-4-carboxamide isomerase [Aureispira sp.]|nr:1-(5-phosphoribosyl)-5-[(5-phosphoribosylamino)methylideneamino]imidazole-4-carboxamide isomerase [Aureispira sp.]
MLNIIPAIDIIDGQCVRLTEGDYNQKKVYNNNPVEVAKAFEDAGFEYLHVVDLDGAKAKHIVNQAILEQIATATNLTIDFGGGIKTTQDIQLALDSGANQVTVGTIAAQQPTLFLEWLDYYGNEKLILGADVKEGYIATHGWQQSSEYTLVDFLTMYIQKGVKYVICTDVSKDGNLQGSAVGLYQELMQQFPELKLIASGGVSSIEEIQQLQNIGCYGAIVGKAIYEQKISLEQLTTL